MRRLHIYIIGIIVITALFTPRLSYSQELTYQGIDVLKENRKAWRYIESVDAHRRQNLKYFDYVDFWVLKNEQQQDQCYQFHADEGTGLIYNRVYDDLVTRYGRESGNNDYIPDFASDDWDLIPVLIGQQKAEIKRTWYPDVEERVMVKLVWTADEGFNVMFFKNLKEYPK